MHADNTGSFVIITGIPFRGGRWLTRALHHPKVGVACYYQAKVLWTSPGHTWWEYAENEATYWDRATSNINDRMDPVYDCYLDELRYQRWRYRVVGDMHSFLPVMVPHLVRHTGARKLISVIRNGVVVVDELWQYYKSGKGSPSAYARVIRRTLGQMDMTIPRQPMEDKPFEWWCRFWASSMYAQDWLQSVISGGVDMTGIQIESLVNIDTLAIFLQGNFPLLAHSEYDYEGWVQSGNEYISDPVPFDVWSKWGERQQDIFRLYCGDAMNHLGYSMPC